MGVGRLPASATYVGGVATAATASIATPRCHTLTCRQSHRRRRTRRNTTKAKAHHRNAGQMKSRTSAALNGSMPSVMAVHISLSAPSSFSSCRCGMSSSRLYVLHGTGFVQRTANVTAIQKGENRHLLSELSYVLVLISRPESTINCVCALKGIFQAQGVRF